MNSLIARNKLADIAVPLLIMLNTLVDMRLVGILVPIRLNEYTPGVLQYDSSIILLLALSPSLLTDVKL